MDDKEIILRLKQMWADNQNSQIFARLAENLYLNKKYSEALKILIKGIKTYPKYISAYIILGKIYTEVEKYDQAQIAFKKALEIDPQNVVAYKGLSDIAFKTGEKEKGIKYLEAILFISPFYSNLREGLKKIKAGALPEEVLQQEEKRPPTEPRIEAGAPISEEPHTIPTPTPDETLAIEETQTVEEKAIAEEMQPPAVIEPEVEEAVQPTMDIEPQVEDQQISQTEETLQMEETLQVEEAPLVEEAPQEQEDQVDEIQDEEIKRMLEKAKEPEEELKEEPEDFLKMAEAQTSIEPIESTPESEEKSVDESKSLEIGEELVLGSDERVEIETIESKPATEQPKPEERKPKVLKADDIIEDIMSEAESIDSDELIPALEDIDEEGKKKPKKEFIFEEDKEVEPYTPPKEFNVPSLTMPGETKEEDLEPPEESIEDSLGLKASMDSAIPTLTLPNEPVEGAKISDEVETASGEESVESSKVEEPETETQEELPSFEKGQLESVDKPEDTTDTPESHTIEGEDLEELPSFGDDRETLTEEAEELLEIKDDENIEAQNQLTEIPETEAASVEETEEYTMPKVEDQQPENLKEVSNVSDEIEEPGLEVEPDKEDEMELPDFTIPEIKEEEAELPGVQEEAQEIKTEEIDTDLDAGEPEIGLETSIDQPQPPKTEAVTEEPTEEAVEDEVLSEIDLKGVTREDTKKQGEEQTDVETAIEEEAPAAAEEEEEDIEPKDKQIVEIDLPPLTFSDDEPDESQETETTMDKTEIPEIRPGTKEVKQPESESTQDSIESTSDEASGTDTESETTDIDGLITRQEFIPTEEEKEETVNGAKHEIELDVSGISKSESFESEEVSTVDIEGLSKTETFEPEESLEDDVEGLEKRDEFKTEEEEIITPTLAEIYTEQKHYQKAIDVYTKLLETAPLEDIEKYRNKIKELQDKLFSESE